MAGAALRVCVVLDAGFNMLADVNQLPGTVTSDADLVRAMLTSMEGLYVESVVFLGRYVKSIVSSGL